VFVSYRRTGDDELVYRLCDLMRTEFGPGRVFVDIDTIRSGVPFVEAIDRALRDTDVVLVMIGPTWANRLDEPGDFVRMEIDQALRLRKPCFPVLMKGAELPPAHTLPEGLHFLLRVNAHVLGGGGHFRDDAPGLLEDIRFVLQRPDGHSPQPARERPTKRWVDVARSRRADARFDSVADNSAGLLGTMLGLIALATAFACWSRWPRSYSKQSFQYDGPHQGRSLVVVAAALALLTVVGSLLAVRSEQSARKAGRTSIGRKNLFVRLLGCSVATGALALAASALANVRMDSPLWVVALTSLLAAGVLTVLCSMHVSNAALGVAVTTIGVSMFLPAVQDADGTIRIGVEQGRGQIVVLVALAGGLGLWLRAATPSLLAVAAVTVLTLLGDYLKGDAYVGAGLVLIAWLSVRRDRQWPAIRK
jgi:hypothetical protein